MDEIQPMENIILLCTEWSLWIIDSSSMTNITLPWG